MDERTVFAATAGTGLALLLGVPAALRRRRQARDEQALSDNVVLGLHVPASLHPVIDTGRCIGSLACLKACPEGDILGIVDGAARLVHGANCIGHGRCAAACPMDAITLVFGDATRGVDLPEVDGHFESSRPGVHLIGELAGMGLIQNAIRQGAECAEHLAEALSVLPARGGPQADVVVVGAGPAGVSCALELRGRGLSVRLLDREQLGAAMASYPRQGLVMTGTLRLPGAPPLRQQRVGKQALLAWFREAIQASGQRVEEGVRVTGLSGQDGGFVVETAAGPIAARKVVLATGRGGTPRRFDVPGGALPKVTRALADAEQYAGARMLVVGGGDAAVEAACALAEGSAATVTLAYRGGALTRCRPANRARAERLAADGRLDLRLGTDVTRVEPDAVALRTGLEAWTLANDYVIACLGGEPSQAFLSQLGVALERPKDAAAGEAHHHAAPAARRLPPEQEARQRWRFRLWLAGVGVAFLVAWLWWMGRSYYLLPLEAHLDSPLHPSFRPAGSLGLTIGVAATAVMLTNFLYALRKRWARLAGVGALGSWLDLHVFVGVMSPVVIAFHAAFQSNNLLAASTYTSLAVVVLTGLIGRYLYGLLPGAGGASVELSDLLGQLERQRGQLAAARGGPLGALLEEAGASPSTAPLPVQLLMAVPGAVGFRLRLAAALGLRPAGERAGLRDALLQLRRLRAQAGLFTGLKRLMRAWRGLHVSLSILLVAALIAHIGLAVYLGYGPRLR